MSNITGWLKFTGRTQNWLTKALGASAADKARHTPEKLTLEQLYILAHAFGWSADDLAEFVECSAKGGAQQ